MKKHIISYVNILSIIIVLLLPINVSASTDDDALSTDSIDILFTHDIHSYLSSYETSQNGSIVEIGGMPRLKTLIDEKRSNNDNLLLLDGGDIAMGTLYQSLYESEAIELSMLGKLGFTATTFGNHEFDYGTDGFARMLESAYEKSIADGSYTLPQYLICNIDWNDATDNSKLAYDALNKIGLHDYIMVNKGGYNIAILGVLGDEAYTDSPRCELKRLDAIESVRKTVDKIKANENADMIVCISHSGTSKDSDESEDELLAKAVPELDVIISAHSHTLLTEPIIYGNTYIVSCKCYSEYSGFVSLSPSDNGRWTLNKCEAIHMTSDIAEDSSILKDLNEFNKSIDKDYLSNYNYTSDTYIAYNDGIEFESVEDLLFKHTEQRLGEFIADAYMYYCNNTPSGAKDPIDITVCPSGTVRGTYYPGPISVPEIFESFSLGNGTDRSAGYPLVRIYLSGEEIKTMAELDATVSDLMKAARLYICGLSFTYNPHRPPLEKVTDIHLIDRPNFDKPDAADEVAGEIDDDTLYSVVSDMYTLEMVSAATSMSKGLLSIIPKHKDGTPITDFKDGIIYNADGSESKAWIAIAKYFESFPEKEYTIDGANYTLPTIPDYYKYTHGRKNIDDDTSPSAILSSPNKYFFMMIGALVVAIIIIQLMILGIIKFIKYIYHKKKSTTNK